ncbi:1-aminocyclopropane-1-carboxylate deaminase [Mesorhizobium sp. L103C131B0]|nr:1-aminocyclopropane-1-carboxylate deaminase [Mesorhizobium sp. L103C131B0]
MLEKFERYPLTFGPTPIEKLDRLGKHLGGKMEIYTKCEDCNSGLAFGGNKLRKLEYIIPDALASNADTLVSIGGVQSNHTRMVAAVAAKIGMKCLLVQESWVPHEDAVYDRVGNILLSRIMGAEVRLGDEGFDIGIRRSWEQALDEVKSRGGRPYAIPAGASVHKYGGLGYVGFAEEVRPGETAWVCLRLHCRLHSHGLDACRHARWICQGPSTAQSHRYRCFCHPRPNQGAGAKHCRYTAKLVDLGTEIVEDDVVLLECARLEGIITDPVYEGKSMQGMVDLVRKGFFPEGSRVLYAHLGGGPAINGYSYTFRNG